MNLITIDGDKFKVYGEGGKGSSGGNEAPNTLRTRQTALVLEVISEGEIDSVSEVYFDDNPISNFDRTHHEVRTGTSSQTYIPGFEDTSASFAVNLEFTNASPYSQAVSSSGIDSVSISYGVKQMIYVDGKGNINGWTVDVAVDYRPDNVSSWTEVFTDTIDGKTTSPYYRDVLINVANPPVAWEFRVRRVTVDNVTAKHINNTWLQAYNEIVDLKLTYDDTALVGLYVDAETTGGRIPVRTYQVKGIKVSIPSNYNPVTRVYTGVWDGTFAVSTAWTDNPAWILYDLLTNTRYGAGISANNVDKFSFYDAGVYSDVLVDDGDGGTEPRFTCNLTIQKRDDTWKVLQSVAGVMRAVLIERGGLVEVLQDSPTSTSEYISNGDVEDGEFTYTTTSLKNRTTSVNVTYNNKDDRYLPRTTTYEDTAGTTRYGLQSRDVSVSGITSEGQAIRFAKWIVDTDLNSYENITFKLANNRINIGVGDVVEIQDEDYANAKFSGKVVSSNATTLVVDEPITLSVGTSTIHYYGTDGVTLHQVVINENNTTTDTFTGTFSSLAYVGATYIMVDGIVAPRLFKVTDLSYTDDTGVTVQGLWYDPTKFARVETGVVVETLVFADVNQFTQLPPQTFAFNEEHYVNTAGQTRLRLYVSWDEPTSGPANKYVLKWSKNQLPYEIVSDIYFTNYTIEDIVPGDYQFQCFALNRNNTRSTPLETTYTIDDTTVSTLVKVIDLKIKGKAIGITDYDTPEAVIEWTFDTTNDNDFNVTLQDYIVEVWEGGSPSTKKNEYVVAKGDGIRQEFRYLSVDNISDFGSKTRDITFKVYNRDVAGRKSLSTDISINNASPDAPTITTQSGFDSYWVEMFHNGSPLAEPDDFAGWLIYANTTPGFTPTASDLVYDGDSDVANIPNSNYVTLYVKAAAYDTFGKVIGELNFSTQGSVTPANVSDSVAVNEYRYDGFNFQANNPTTNQISWSAGTGSQVEGVDEDRTWTVIAGNATWTTGTLYLYVVAPTPPTATAVIQTTTSLTTAITGTILATYRGGVDLTEGSSGGAFIDGGKILAQTVGAGQIVANTITANQLSTGEIITLSAQIKNLIVTEAKIAALAVTAAKIGSLAVTTAKINTAAVTNAKIGNLAVDTAQIASLAVETAKINTAAITNAKIANLAVDTAQIASLAVETIKIAGQAVTIPVSSYTAGNQGCSSTCTIQTLTFTSTGAPVTISVSINTQASNVLNLLFDIKRGSTVINTVGINTHSSYSRGTSCSISDTPGAGSVTYTVVVRSGGGGNFVNTQFSNRYLGALETKK